MERLHILDGYGYVFRAFYGLATAGRDRQGVHLTTAAGLPTGALYVYAQMLIRLHQDVKPDRIVVVFDAPGKGFRGELDPNYKANRKEPPDDLRAQMPYFRPLTEAFRWPVIAVPGVEADDVIATATRQARARDWDVVIYSGDKDLMQLVDDRVTVIDSMRRVTYDTARVTDKFGVAPKLVADWLALVGDSSDNVPGMAGVGKVTASKLLNQYGSVDAVIEHASELKGKLKERFEDPSSLAQLAVSRQLVALKTDVDLPLDLDAFVAAPWDSSRLMELFQEFEFWALLERLGAKAPSRAPGADTAGATAGPLERAEPVVAEPVVAEPVVAESAQQVADEMKHARAAGKMAVHLEGDGARHDRERAVGLAVAVPGRPALYLSLGHRYLGAPRSFGKEDLAPLAQVLADPKVKIVCHDAKQLYKLSSRLGMEVEEVVFDLMLVAYLLDSSSDRYDLETSILDACGFAMPARVDLVGKGKKAIPWESVDVATAARYAGSAASALLRCEEELAPRIQRAGMSRLWAELELPLARVLAQLEMTGISIDEKFLGALADSVGQRIAELESRVFVAAGGPFNLGSPKQLATLLFETLGLKSEMMKKTKTGYSTDHEVLEGLVGQHEVVPLILEHRELLKLKGTYIDALPPLVNPSTRRLHTSFKQAVTATGRLSSQEPNLQNIPIRTELGREIRRAFVAPPGSLLVSADYSQIELRVMAHLSGDPVLVRAFAEDIDVHTQTAAEVFDIALEDVGGTERRVAKAVNYGLIYGQSDFGLGRALGIPRAEAKHYIERYFARFSKVRDFMDEIVARARREGAAFTIQGRRRPIPDLAGKNYRMRSAAERIAQNTPMQGSAADIMKLAMLRVDRLLSQKSFDGRMLLTVHDELVFEVAQHQAEDLADAVRKEMEAAYALRVPLKVDVGIADNWADAH